MTWMNEMDVVFARRNYGDDPVLAPAVETLSNLVDWTNSNSDGWPYWKKPSNAARALMSLIQAEDARRLRYSTPKAAATAEDVAKALRPIKAFRTRQGADFTIVEPAQGCIRGM